MSAPEIEMHWNVEGVKVLLEADYMRMKYKVIQVQKTHDISTEYFKEIRIQY
ncbi:hypothetical protein A3Q56_05852 [Intoshia linei]|uniref:Uncharacterized protein n=1 Tax=Intoshia linei TaxID=1819745 RepID=A0A177AWM9_9BILA|nr:hypothetical protein A3Q56_05852 [Intoshia linei]